MMFAPGYPAETKSSRAVHTAMAELFAELAGLFLLPIPMTLFSGWVVATLWRWFVLPLGAPALGVAHAAGLLLLYATLRGIDNKKPDKEREFGTWSYAVLSVVGRLLLLGVGYVLKGAM